MRLQSTLNYYLCCKFAIKTNLSCLTVGVGPASIMVGNLVAGKRIAQASGRDLGLIDDQEQSRKVSQRFQDYCLVSSLLISLHNMKILVMPLISVML